MFFSEDVLAVYDEIMNLQDLEQSQQQQHHHHQTDSEQMSPTSSDREVSPDSTGPDMPTDDPTPSSSATLASTQAQPAPVESSLDSSSKIASRPGGMLKRQDSGASAVSVEEAMV